MSEALRHRGPDGVGELRQGPAVLGHRRLAIIDLSPAGRQPMANEDATVWLIFNGEIYNFQQLRRQLAERGHQFSSQTDSEVILHGYEEWGMDALLERLRGMFAFALLDCRPPGAKLFLARDRFGIKPLYFWRSGDLLLFASEVKALLKSGRVERQTNPAALVRFFEWGSVPEPETIVRGVEAVPAGGYGLAQGREFLIHRRYRLQEALRRRVQAGEAAIAPQAAPQAIRTWLEEAVELHLVSDAPLGVFLSGGIDSSALAALAARRLKQPLATVSVLFEEAEYSEAPYIARMSEKLGSRHTPVLVRRTDFADSLPRLLEAMDQPSVDGVNSYFVAWAARKAGLTVVLSGLGGDEIFFGYRHFKSARSLGAAWKIFKSLPQSGRRAAARLAAVAGGLSRKGALERAPHLADSGDIGFYRLYRGLFGPRRLQELLGLSRAEIEAAALPQSDTGAGSLLHSVSMLEFEHYLKNQLLRDTDAMTMAHSLETRVPFLDHEVVERTLSLPAKMKFNGRINKPLLVQALGADLPRQVWDRPKMGFSFPMRQWIRQGSEELRRLCRSGSLDRGAVDRMWTDFEDGRVHWSLPWATLVASRWT